MRKCFLAHCIPNNSSEQNCNRKAEKARSSHDLGRNRVCFSCCSATMPASSAERSPAPSQMRAVVRRCLAPINIQQSVPLRFSTHCVATAMCQKNLRHRCIWPWFCANTMRRLVRLCCRLCLGAAVFVCALFAVCGHHVRTVMVWSECSDERRCAPSRSSFKEKKTTEMRSVFCLWFRND